MRELYQETMNQIHASKGLLDKIKTLKPDTKRKSYALRKICSIAAVATVFLITGNIFAQAVKGFETIKPDKHEIVLDYRLTGEGRAGFTCIEIAHDTLYQPGVAPDLTDYAGSELLDAQITWENEKIYLKVASQKIEITKDIMDKHCEGTITTDERTYDYIIDGYVYDYLLVFSFE